MLVQFVFVLKMYMAVSFYERGDNFELSPSSTAHQHQFVFGVMNPVACIAVLRLMVKLVENSLRTAYLEAGLFHFSEYMLEKFNPAVSFR